MPELEKLVVAAMHSGSLESDPDREVPLDRVMAFAVGALREPLGEALCRLKYLNEVQAYDDALRLLTARSTRPNESRRQSRRICQVVLDEWFNDQCQSCAGRGVLIIEGTPHARSACAVCGGSGREPIFINRRCAALGTSVDGYHRVERRLARAWSVLSMAEERLWEVVGGQLGRRTAVALRGKRRILPGSPADEAVGGAAEPGAQGHNNDTIPVAPMVGEPTAEALARP